MIPSITAYPFSNLRTALRLDAVALDFVHELVYGQVEVALADVALRWRFYVYVRFDPPIPKMTLGC